MTSVNVFGSSKHPYILVAFKVPLYKKPIVKLALLPGYTSPPALDLKTKYLYINKLVELKPYNGVYVKLKRSKARIVIMYSFRKRYSLTLKHPYFLQILYQLLIT